MTDYNDQFDGKPKVDLRKDRGKDPVVQARMTGQITPPQEKVKQEAPKKPNIFARAFSNIKEKVNKAIDNIKQGVKALRDTFHPSESPFDSGQDIEGQYGSKGSVNFNKPEQKASQTQPTQQTQEKMSFVSPKTTLAPEQKSAQPEVKSEKFETMEKSNDSLSKPKIETFSVSRKVINAPAPKEIKQVEEQQLQQDQSLSKMIDKLNPKPQPKELPKRDVGKINDKILQKTGFKPKENGWSK